MKKLFSYLSIIAFIMCLFTAPALACGLCGPGCGGPDCFSGKVSQENGAFDTAGKVTYNKKKDEYTVENGAIVSGSNKSKGSYNGTVLCDGWGVGGAATFGGTLLYANHCGKTNTAAGITGNVSAAGFGGNHVRRGCAKISGSGSLNTGAFSQKGDAVAYANSSGSFKYSGKTGHQGVIIGGGLTGGFSHTTLDPCIGTVAAAAGQISVSGVGTMNMGGCGGCCGQFD